MKRDPLYFIFLDYLFMQSYFVSAFTYAIKFEGMRVKDVRSISLLCLIAQIEFRKGSQGFNTIKQILIQHLPKFLADV